MCSNLKFNHAKTDTHKYVNQSKHVCRICISTLNNWTVIHCT